MPKKNTIRIPGAFVLIMLEDGTYSYGRVRNDALVSFYNYNTLEPVYDLELISSQPIIFSIWVHKSAFKKWEYIGKLPLTEDLAKGIKRFRQNIADHTKCLILDEEGYERKATQEECINLERSSVWEAEHVEERILDSIKGKPNRIVEMQKVKF